MKKKILYGIVIVGILAIILFLIFNRHDNALDRLYKNKISSYVEIDKYTIDEYEEHISIVTYNGDEEIVEVPKSINGKPVLTIEDSAFYGNLKVKKIVLPDTIIRVGHQSFIGCLELKEINIPSSVLDFGEHALDNCPNLEKIYVDKSSNIGKKLSEYGFKNLYQ
ncbi:MAG: leucine-rich repeat protein [Bacilli bacterium]|nr:leucine-rich repeat protein [Bacilli bacterium]